MQEIQIESGVIKAKECLKEADTLIQPAYALFFCMALVVTIIPIALYYIPYAGWLLSVIFSSSIICCFYLATLKQSRNEAPHFSLFFTEFPKYLKTTPITVLETIPTYIPDVIALYETWFLNTADRTTDISPSENLVDTQAVFYFSVSILIGLVISTILIFARPLIVDRNIGLSESIVLSAKGVFANPGGVIFLVILQGLMLILGIFGCGIGFFLAMPICYAMTIVAYMKIYPFNPPESPDTPPLPQEYGDAYGSAQ